VTVKGTSPKDKAAAKKIGPRQGKASTNWERKLGEGGRDSRARLCRGLGRTTLPRFLRCAGAPHSKICLRALLMGPGTQKGRSPPVCCAPLSKQRAGMDLLRARLAFRPHASWRRRRFIIPECFRRSPDFSNAAASFVVSAPQTPGRDKSTVARDFCASADWPADRGLRPSKHVPRIPCSIARRRLHKRVRNSASHALINPSTAATDPRPPIIWASRNDSATIRSA